jgi:hypothetical protein
VTAALAVAAVAIAIAVTVVGRTPPADRRPVRTVDVVGDSLVTQAASDLNERLAGAGLYATVVHRPRQDLGSAFVQDQLAAVRSRPPADVLVLATAANDALRNGDRSRADGADAAAGAFDELLDRSVAPFADRCVVVVNAREDIADIYRPDQARILNGRLRTAGDRHPNLVVVDWATASRSVPADWFASDQLHFGPDPNGPASGSGSSRAYAAAIIDGIGRCPPPP